jgi:hypothetical protein
MHIKEFIFQPAQEVFSTVLADPDRAGLALKAT